MQQNGQGRSVRRENDQLGDAAIERLGRCVCGIRSVAIPERPLRVDLGGWKQTFIRTLFQLTVMRGLLNEVEDGLAEALVGDGPCCGFCVSLRI